MLSVSLTQKVSPFQRTVLDANVIGPLIAIREAMKRMSTSAGGAGGAIVNVSSGAAYVPNNPVLYSVSKGALNSMMSSLTAPLMMDGVRLNTVSPGATDTDMVAGMLPEGGIYPTSVIPAGRAGTPMEIAEGICWLLSDAASYVAGENMRIAGGRP